MSRPSWDQTFLALAATWAKRATCLRGKFGAVYVDAAHQVLSSGYNGAPRGMPHCNDSIGDNYPPAKQWLRGCQFEDGHCIRTVHAEMNGIIQAARTGVSLVGSQLYVTGRSCRRCCVAIVQAGISEVIYPLVQAYHTDSEAEALKTLESGGVVVRTVDFDCRPIFELIGAWQDATFPKSTDHSKLTHLRKELAELEANPSDGEEMADVVFLLLHLARGRDIDLMAEIARKFAINQARTWQAPDADGVVEHVREVKS